MQSQKVRKTFVDFGFSLRIKRPGSASYSTVGRFDSKHLAEKHAREAYPGAAAHIERVRLESTTQVRSERR